jgi:beta-xylosidase
VGQWTCWGQQPDSIYIDPVLPSDYSDLDCIRVGDDFYAISSTMQFSPGMTVLHSTDLVNWEVVGTVEGMFAEQRFVVTEADLEWGLAYIFYCMMQTSTIYDRLPHNQV